MIETRSGRWFVVLMSLAVPVGTLLATDVDLKPVQKRLASDSKQDRITGVREMMRLKPSAAAARPLLQELVDDPEPEVRAETVWAIEELLGEKGTDLLEKLYNDDSNVVRDGAIRAACKMWDKPRPKDLCRAASEDPDFGARVEVLQTLRENFPKDPDAHVLFRRALKDPSESVVRSAVLACQAARDPLAVPDLARIARTMGDLAAEPAASEALATIATPEAVRELMQIVPKPSKEALKANKGRPSDVVRAGAARALARIKNPEALPVLRAAMADPAIAVRIGAAQGLVDMKDEQSVPLFVKMLSDPDPRLRRTALRALDKLAKADQKVGDVTVADAVRNVLKTDKDSAVRASAVPVLADLLKERAVPDLAALSTDLDAAVRLEAAGALAGIGKPAADALVSFASDADANVRAMAIEGIGQIGGTKQVPVLVKAAEDTSTKSAKQIRIAAAGALGSVGGPEATAALAKLAKDADPGVRQATAVALGKLGGPKAKELLDALLKDEVTFVRTAARKSLDALNAKR
ncbi:MAG: HEAT repeat domain-containing protein [Acidobacteria bacterium]|nr:HEAT repeat domain-containing protein [Acidobacteriota bacterium]